MGRSAAARGRGTSVTAGMILSVALGCVALLLVTLLTLPVSVRARGLADGDQLWGELRAMWAWGVLGATLAPGRRQIALFGWPLSLLKLSGAISRWRGRRGAKATERRSRRRSKSTARAAQSERIPLLARLEELKAHARTLRVVAGRLVSALHLRLTLEGVAGLDDPADTALAHEVIRVAAQTLPDGVEICLEPDYLDGQLRLRSQLSLTVWPGEILWCAFRLLLRRDVWRTLRALRS